MRENIVDMVMEMNLNINNNNNTKGKYITTLKHYSLKTYGDVQVNIKSLTVSALDGVE
jgi:hypothetical protein